TRKVVIVFTSKRSGSSFLGEMFNQNPNAFYLFEPLFPFTRTCTVLRSERVDALRQFTQCKFDNITQVYENAFKVTNYTDEYAQCLNNTICFEERHSPLLKKHKTICRNLHAGKCSLPMQPKLISELCLQSKLVVYKILRVCDLETLSSLFKSSRKKNDIDMKLIHLVRDPRAILSSRINVSNPVITLKIFRASEYRSWNLKAEAQLLCKRLRTNLKFADTYWRAPNIKYKRIRHEDITSRPEQSLMEIYGFVGESVPEDVKKWLKGTTQPENVQGIRSNFSTTRKASNVLNTWRRNLSYIDVQQIQNECEDVLQYLGYTIARDENHQKNETLVL
uniref:Sulfotransferase n=1 Tax=Ciona savignyi TaxID=51511 RepID=H2ZM12_CIOSA